MTVDIADAKIKLEQLVNGLAPGEELVLEKQGRAVAKLVRLDEMPGPRLPGSAKGKFTVPDDFDDPLPKEIEDSFYE